MCWSTAKWKREQVNDHKFDYIDVREFVNNKDVKYKIRYSWLFLKILKSTLLYIADLWTGVSLLAFPQLFNTQIGGAVESSEDSNDSLTSKINNWIPIYGKWIFFASVIMAYILLLWEIKKARNIIRSRDISYAFTSIFVYRLYCLTSYPHFCFFELINHSKRTKDSIAFWVFFTLKGWKRLMFSDAPRQIINGWNLYLIYAKVVSKKGKLTSSIGDYINSPTPVKIMSFAIINMTVLIFIFSAITVIAAAMIYIPLIFDVRGNLKEYCCHKIDKRIADILRKNSKKRARKERELANMSNIELNNMSRINSQKESVIGLEPTLPKIDLDDEERDTFSDLPTKESLLEPGKYKGLSRQDSLSSNSTSTTSYTSSSRRVRPQRQHPGFPLEDVFHNARQPTLPVVDLSHDPEFNPALARNRSGSASSEDDLGSNRSYSIKSETPLTRSPYLDSTVRNAVPRRPNTPQFSYTSESPRSQSPRFDPRPPPRHPYHQMSNSRDHSRSDSPGYPFRR